MRIKPKDFYSYFINLPIGAVHLAIYSGNASYIRQLTKESYQVLNFDNISNLDSSTASYTIHNSHIACSAIEVYHLGNTLEEAIHSYPHLFI